MSRGTPSMGKHGNKKTHRQCPRCGKASMHRRTKICAACGFGKSAKRNDTGKK